MTVELRAITKQFALKTALDGVSVFFGEGKIHALLGENGAGKSTLAGIISGATAPSGGDLLVDGEAVRFEKPRQALDRGIVIVQQRPLLSDALTAKENISLQLTGGLAEKGGRKAVAKALKELKALRDNWAPDLPLAVPVQNLGGNHRFYTAFLGALLLSPRFLILDEPSAFLGMEERQALYEHLRAARLTVLVITHSGAEAETYADTVTVLQKGRLAARYESADAYRSWLKSSPVLPTDGAAALLRPTDADLQAFADPGREKHQGDPGTRCFSLEHVSCRPRNKSALLDASLTVRYGEITAVTGLKEAALDTLEDVVTGMQVANTKGRAIFCPENASVCEFFNLARKPLSTAFLRRHHTAIVPSDKTFRASNPNLTVQQMLTVYLRQGNPKAVADYAQKLIQQAGVAITPGEKTSSLSGGMLQRLILTRELAENPSCIILCNPLQGLDKRGQRKMTEVILRLSKQGKAVLIVGAADFPLSLCASVYALESGSLRLVHQETKGAFA